MFCLFALLRSVELPGLGTYRSTSTTRRTWDGLLILCREPNFVYGS